MPLEIDEDSVPTAISDNSYALIQFKQPSPIPFTVKVRGSGFFADAGHVYRDAQYNSGGGFKVYTANACGVATITITDGCSITEVTVFSTDGHWKTAALGTYDKCHAYNGSGGSQDI